MVYLLHFSGRLGNERHSAQHYLGFCPDGTLDNRLAEHEHGAGARITAAAVERGFSLRVARTWNNGDRKLERRLKNQKHSPRLCPLCQR